MGSNLCLRPSWDDQPNGDHQHEAGGNTFMVVSDQRRKRIWSVQKRTHVGCSRLAHHHGQSAPAPHIKGETGSGRSRSARMSGVPDLHIIMCRALLPHTSKAKPDLVGPEAHACRVFPTCASSRAERFWPTHQRRNRIWSVQKRSSRPSALLSRSKSSPDTPPIFSTVVMCF